LGVQRSRDLAVAGGEPDGEPGSRNRRSVEEYHTVTNADSTISTYSTIGRSVVATIQETEGRRGHHGRRPKSKQPSGGIVIVPSGGEIERPTVSTPLPANHVWPMHGIHRLRVWYDLPNLGREAL
jgi:hypothetical protein